MALVWIWLIEIFRLVYLLVVMAPCAVIAYDAMHHMAILTFACLIAGGIKKALPPTDEPPAEP